MAAPWEISPYEKPALRRPPNLEIAMESRPEGGSLQRRDTLAEQEGNTSALAR